MITVKVAHSKKILNQIGRLRYKFICEANQYKDPTSFPDHIEFDKYDEFAVNFAVIKDGKVIGTDRLVRDSKLGLPMEEAFKLSSFLHRKSIVEISRLAFDNNHPHNPYLILKLFGENYRHSLDHGITHWCAAVEEDLFESFLKLGFCFTVIGEKSYFKGPEWGVGSLVVPALPVLLDLEEVESHLRSTNPTLYERILGNKIATRPSQQVLEKSKAIKSRINSYLQKIDKTTLGHPKSLN